MVQYIPSQHLYLCAAALLVSNPVNSTGLNADFPRNVGFLRYWTLSNLPLFALAVPMLALIFVSASWGLRASKSQLHPLEPYKRMASASNNATIRTLAFPQLVLAVLALTNFHVQIITRISSAYPVLYIWLASRIIGREPFPPVWLPIKPQLMVYWMVVYALVQASLFAGFLPPA